MKIRKSEPWLYPKFSCYLSYGILFLIGYFRELFSFGGSGEKDRVGYVPLYNNFEGIYIRHIFSRFKAIFFQPIISEPGPIISLLHRDPTTWRRKSSSSPTATTAPTTTIASNCINLGSYNYLGFAQKEGPSAEASIASIRFSGLTPCSSVSEFGMTRINQELNETLSSFLGVEATITFGMGFATNSCNLPVLVSNETLILSDQYNHASICLGLRLSGAFVQVFKHNDMRDLEEKIRRAIIVGQPRSRRPWSKILIVVEGIYSMEGTIVNLPSILSLKKKYGLYIYLDEAHSIGAIGHKGRGVIDYYSLPSSEIDIQMGTFTKSFGAAGGYIAGKKELIDYIRFRSHAANYGSPMPPPVAAQILSALHLLSSTESYRIKNLAGNVKYFRSKLLSYGFILRGSDESPVVPLLLYNPSKVKRFVVELISRKVAVVGVGYPASPFAEEKIRFCLSASHTKEMLDEVLAAVSIVGDITNVKYGKYNEFKLYFCKLCKLLKY